MNEIKIHSQNRATELGDQIENLLINNKRTNVVCGKKAFQVSINLQFPRLLAYYKQHILSIKR
jgi:hypothetical protein